MSPLLEKAEQRKAVLKSESPGEQQDCLNGKVPTCTVHCWNWTQWFARFKRSKALSIWEKYTMSKMFYMLDLKEALDSIIMEVFNFHLQPSPLFTAEMQLFKELSLKELLMPKWASLQTDWMRWVLPEDSEVVFLVSGLHKQVPNNNVEEEGVYATEILNLFL